MLQKLTKCGDDWAVVIDETTLNQLGINPDTPLEVTTDGRHVLIGPVDSARASKFKAALEETNRRFGPALRKLAE